MTDIPPEFNPETAPPSLTIDWDAYLPFFEDEDISEEDKHALIEALWSITVSFVDLGFGVHPVQQVCGQDQEDLALMVADVLSSDDRPTDTDDDATPQSGGVSERTP